MQKVRYSRLWSFGNYENEKVELEQEFSDEVPYSEALSFLMDKVTKDHEQRVRMREVIQETDRLEHELRVYQTGDVYYGAEPTPEAQAAQVTTCKKQLAAANRQLRKLNKELLGE